MALTAEQQSQLEFVAATSQQTADIQTAVAAAQTAAQTAAITASRNHEIAMEALRKDSMLAVEAARASNESSNRAVQYRAAAVSLAKDILLENRKDLPAGSRQVTGTEITTLATSLISFVEA